MGTSEWLRTVRAYRPPHAVNALGARSELLLLNPRDLRRVAQAPLARMVVPSAALLPSVFRAARDSGAIVGLAKPGVARGEGPAPLAFAQSVFRAAEAVGYPNPFFLAPVPLALDPGDTEGERLRAEVQRYLDAGFTEVIVHAEEWDPAAAGPALRTALESAKERDVALGLWSATEQKALDLHAALARQGVVLDLLSLGAPGEFERVGQLIDLLRPTRLEVAHGGEAPAELGGLAVSAPMSGFMAGVEGSSVTAESYSAPLPGDASQIERVEALLYVDLLSELQVAPMRGASARALQGLSARREG